MLTSKLMQCLVCNVIQLVESFFTLRLCNIAELSHCLPDILLSLKFLVLIGANIKKQKLKSSKSTDRRTTKIKEVVASIKSIKMLVWEKYFLNWVHSERT